MRQDVNINFSDAAEKEKLGGLTPTGDEEEDNEAEKMVRGSQCKNFNLNFQLFR